MNQFNQPASVPNNEPYIQDQVIADMEERKALGIERYKTGLQPFNGRNSPVDAYEEILDLANYAKTWIVERKRIVAAFEAIAQSAQHATSKLIAIKMLLDMGEWDESGDESGQAERDAEGVAD